jgi:hypothetical protein
MEHRPARDLDQHIARGYPAKSVAAHRGRAHLPGRGTETPAPGTADRQRNAYSRSVGAPGSAREKRDEGGDVPGHTRQICSYAGSSACAHHCCRHLFQHAIYFTLSRVVPGCLELWSLCIRELQDRISRSPCGAGGETICAEVRRARSAECYQPS